MRGRICRGWRGRRGKRDRRCIGWCEGLRRRMRWRGREGWGRSTNAQLYFVFTLIVVPEQGWGYGGKRAVDPKRNGFPTAHPRDRGRYGDVFAVDFHIFEDTRRIDRLAAYHHPTRVHGLDQRADGGSKII